MNVLSETLGVPESGLRLVGSVLAAYPLALVHRWCFWGRSSTSQNIFFASTGMGLTYWCYGKDIIHSFICTLTQWAFLKFLGDSRHCLPLSFAFQVGYLLWGYKQTESEDYDICWTMTGCIMCLRLIGLAYDRYDGNKSDDKIRKDQKERALKESPSLLEVFGFSYSFMGLTVGPQYPMSLYRQLVDGELTEEKGKKPKTVIKAIAVALTGVVLMGLNEVLKMYFPMSFLETDTFLTEWPYLKRMGYISLAGMAHMHKYISIWTLGNGALILTGMGYVKKEDGKTNWNALANIKIGQYMRALSYGDMIKSFNANTNDWVARYIYKRCIWIGNRNISQAAVLGFLAIWHGYHLCYFIMFALEYFVVNGEKEIFKFTASSKLVQSLPQSVRNAFSYIYISATWGFVIIEFSLLVKHKYMPVWSSIYYSHFIFWLVTYFGLRTYNRLSAPRSRQKTE